MANVHSCPGCGKMTPATGLCFLCLAERLVPGVRVKTFHRGHLLEKTVFRYGNVVGRTQDAEFVRVRWDGWQEKSSTAVRMDHLEIVKEMQMEQKTFYFLVSVTPKPNSELGLEPAEIRNLIQSNLDAVDAHDPDVIVAEFRGIQVNNRRVVGDLV